MKYQIVQFPFEGIGVSKQEISAALSAFYALKKERLQYVCKQAGLRDDSLSLTGLQGLEYWLVENLTISERSQHSKDGELMKVPAELRSVHRPIGFEVVEPGKSMLFDCALYFGELLISKVRDTSWDICSATNSQHFSNLVITKENNELCLSPFGVLRISSLKIMEDRFPEGQLVKTLAHWQNNFNGIFKDYHGMIRKWLGE